MSPIAYLVAFTIMLGWEGPLLVYVGLIHESLPELLVGAILTLIFWGFFGLRTLLDVARICATKISRWV